MGNVKSRPKGKAGMYFLLGIITILVVLPFIWMLMLSFKTNAEIFNNPISLPTSFNLENYQRVLNTLNLGQLYSNTIFIVVVTMVIELVITFSSSFVLAKMTFKKERHRSMIYTFLILGLTISPFILLFPVYQINSIFGFKEQFGLILPYVATSISFNTLLFVAHIRTLPGEVDEAAIIDGCNLWQLLLKIIVPMAKPVIATVVIFNVLYVWNEFPFASIMLRDASHYTLSLGASFFKGKYNIDYAGIIASSVFIIIPQLIFYGIFQKNIVDGITAGAVKG